MPRPSARQRLLDSAERLFADHGVAGVSLRAINADAGLSPAALHYHFGSREKLVEALLERRMPRLMARRSELLDALEALPGPPSARELAAVLLRPLAELLVQEGESGRRYLRLLCRLQADGDIDERHVLARYRSGVERLLPLLERALPGQPPHLVRLRLALVVETLLRALASWQTLAAAGHDDAAPRDLDEVVHSLLDFLAGGFDAPVSARAPSNRSSATPSAARAAGGLP